MPLPEVPPLMLVETSALNAAEDKEGRAGTGHNHGPVFHTRGLTLTAEYHAIQYVTTHRGKTYTQPMNLADRDRYEVSPVLHVSCCDMPTTRLVTPADFAILIPCLQANLTTLCYTDNRGIYVLDLCRHLPAC